MYNDTQGPKAIQDLQAKAGNYVPIREAYETWDNMSLHKKRSTTKAHKQFCKEN